MLNKLKKHVLDRYLDMRLKLFNRDEDALNFPQKIRQVQSVLLLIPEGEEYSAFMQQFTSQLYGIFKRVQISTFERSSFRKSDGNWFGLPKDSYLKNFQDAEFDLIIDLNQPQDRLCAYICALSGAPLRMTWTSGDYDHIYNLQIRSSQGLIEDQLKNLLNYLKSFMKDS